MTDKRETRQVLNPCWTRLTEGFLHSSIRSLVTTLGVTAAKFPLQTIGATGFVSLAFLAIGFFTNFELELDQLVFLTPTNSLPQLHGDWIASEESGFPKVRPFFFVYHANGDNVVTTEAMRVALRGMELLEETDDFLPHCDQSKFMGIDRQPTCWTSSVTRFWNHNATLFEQQLAAQAEGSNPEEWIQATVSASVYPDTTPVFHEAILGRYKGYNTTTNQPITHTDAPPLSLTSLHDAAQGVDNQMFIESAQALVMKVDIPDLGERTDNLELRLMDRYHDFQKEQNVPENRVKVEYFTMNGYQTEMMRAVYIDLPLVAVLTVVMLAFTIFVFYDRHEPVKSRGLLGSCSMTTIGLSLATGYGAMWMIGVPLTTVGIMIPFVVVGVGLDDTFIITGTYFRLLRESPVPKQLDEDNQKEGLTLQEVQTQHVIQVVEEALNECGVSITMTSLTTLIAFMVGSASSIPAVRWLCWYAAACLFAVYVYQLTCFVAMMVMDERRILANRKDMMPWIVVPDETEEPNENEEQEEDLDIQKFDTIPTHDVSENEDIKVEAEVSSVYDNNEGGAHKKMSDGSASSGVPEQSKPPSPPLSPTSTTTSMSATAQDTTPKRSTAERFMSWYADMLLKPTSKIFVLVLFVAYFAGSIYSTSLLYQEFNVDHYIPEDSFMVSFMDAFRDYSTVFRYIGVYFRNVDQSDPAIQQQMMNYVQEIAEMPEIGEDPAFFWLRDLDELANSEQAANFPINVSSLSTEKQVDLALSIPQLNQIYRQDIVQDPDTGNITASRTFLYLRHLDIYDTIPEQVDMLNNQRDISFAQPVNQPEHRVNDQLSFFTFDEVYFFWEVYDVVVDELIFTTISCVIIVSVLAFIMIPHWTSLLFVCPLLIMMYFNLLGTMQLCGIKVNSITYFIIVMAIGLLVDFLMHVLLRYYETTGKTREEKVKQTLETMGVPIMLGALTTFLGVLPLALSTTKIFITVFLAFLTLVALGAIAGLVLLPVLLSLFGPVVTVSINPVGEQHQQGEALEDESLPTTQEVQIVGLDGEPSSKMVVDGVEWLITDDISV